MTVCLACHGERLATLYATATGFRLFELTGDDICPAGILSLPSKDPTDRTSALLACGASFLVCGAISGGDRYSLEQAGLTVVAFLRGGVDEVVAALRRGDLSTLAMPGSPLPRPFRPSV